ncbi:PP2C family protein-serine/threonine phosphatase [Streptomyces sp. NPDC101227]|uniref:PP2C family protein-serine/threonine phosphatase n=1 Tax=Streptomyces sp. NPDC101227 TaxID=3366136 RepID=UPI0037F336EB
MIRAWARGGAPAAAPRAAQVFVLVLPGVWVLAVVSWELCRPSSGQLLQLLAAAPAIACAGTGRRQCVLLGGACALLALVPFGAVEPAAGFGTRAATCGAVLAVICASYLTAGRRRRLLGELERSREVAGAAQRVLLRPLPSRIDGMTLAAGHLSASEGAVVGGDLYDVAGTRYGVRAVIGDVRGHGLEALGTVAAMLGSFREAVHDEPELGGVLRRLERAHQRHLRERAGTGQPAGPAAEEFVTLLLLEVDRDGAVTALNCGHPWPYPVGGPAAASEAAQEAAAEAVPLSSVEPMPPLGLFPLPDELPTVDCGRLGPGEGLFLHTDGATDTRDAAGEFFPLARELRRADGRPGRSPAGLVEDVRQALLRHSRGRPTDDVALVVLCHDRPGVPAAPPGPAPAPFTPRVKRGSLR